MSVGEQAEHDVRVSDLHVVYPSRSGDIHAVRGVDLVIPPGSTVGVVGESGSGKSTLARAIVGLVPATGGQVEVKSQPVHHIGRTRDRHMAAACQMIFQDPYTALNPRQKPIRAIAEAVRFWQNCTRSEALIIAKERLREVGISDLQATRSVGTLSGGQLQRVAIARALVPEPSVLVADEPTSALDQSIAASILNLLRRTQQRRDLTILFISHDLGLVRYLSNSVYVMKDGRVVETGNTTKIFQQPQNDYTKSLIAAIPGTQER